MDPRTLFLLSILFMLLNGGVLGLMHKSLAEDVRAAAKDWRVGTLLMAGGMALLGAQEPASMAILLPTGNAIVCAAALLYWRALCRFAGQPDPARWAWLPIGFVLVAVWWFSTVEVSFARRVMVASPVLGGYLLAAAWTGRRFVRQGGQASLQVLTGALGIVALFLFLRAGYYSVAGDGGTTFVTTGTVLNVVTLLVTAVLPVIGTTAFLVLCSERARIQAERAAATDYLTGLPNRRTISALGRTRFAAAKTSEQPWTFAVAVIDLDHFKSINDRHGHDVGDAALRHVAALLATHCRGPHRVGRQGGEEFVVLLDLNTREEAAIAAERLRAALEAHPLPLPAGELTVQASFGVGLMAAGDADYEIVLKRADQALYRAKENGRNRVEVGSPEGVPD